VRKYRKRLLNGLIYFDVALEDMAPLNRLTERLASVQAALEPVRRLAIAYVGSGGQAVARKTKTTAVPPEDYSIDNWAQFKEGDWDLTEAGYCTYKGRRFPLEGKNRRVLARLIQSKGRAVGVNSLNAACGNDPEAMADPKQTIATRMTLLRNHLRKHLGKDFRNEFISYKDPDSYALLIPPPA
jgi:hypothetical protein